MNLVASVLGLIGTWIQMTQQLGRLSASDPEGYAALKVIEGWKDEHAPVRHPVRWLRARSIVKSLLRGSPSEALEYRRAARGVFAWVCLVGAAGMFVAANSWDLLRVTMH